MQFRIFFNMRLINLFIRKFQSFFSIKKQHIPQKCKFHINSEKYLTLAVEKDEKKRTKEKLIKVFEYSSQVKFDE